MAKKKIEAPFDLMSDDGLRLIAEAAEMLALEVGEKVNPTNVFVYRYNDLSKACHELLKLIEERGHRGLPEGI